MHGNDTTSRPRIERVRESKARLARVIYARRRAWYIEFMRGRTCQDCGREWQPKAYALNWHHRDPTTKRFNVGSGTEKCIPVTIAEIAKCELLCVKCHRRRHPQKRDENGGFTK
jgi:hypothetical protein